MSTISCSIGYGRGGLGQHFAQLVEEARARGELRRYYTPDIRSGDEGVGQVVRRRWGPFLLRRTPVKYFQGWRWHVECDSWDRKVAREMGEPAGEFVAFGGQALRSFRAARARGCGRLELVAANSHVGHCTERYRAALARHPIEGSWLGGRHARKTLAEYVTADSIVVASEYCRQSFIERGVPAAKLRRVRYAVDPRFAAAAGSDKPGDGVLRIVYIGAVSVLKGVPILVEALAKLRGVAAELTLVGGTASRGMRRYVADAIARDSRIKLAPGDPLPHLRRADVCVHPSWEDGLAYAPLEALAAGVPVIVSRDTGMKEFLAEGRNGYVVPTGDVEALAERLAHMRDHPIRGAGMAASAGVI